MNPESSRIRRFKQLAKHIPIVPVINERQNLLKQLQQEYNINVPNQLANLLITEGRVSQGSRNYPRAPRRVKRNVPNVPVTNVSLMLKRLGLKEFLPHPRPQTKREFIVEEFKRLGLIAQPNSKNQNLYNAYNTALGILPKPMPVKAFRKVFGKSAWKPYYDRMIAKHYPQIKPKEKSFKLLSNAEYRRLVLRSRRPTPIVLRSRRPTPVVFGPRRRPVSPNESAGLVRPYRARPSRVSTKRSQNMFVLGGEAPKRLVWPEGIPKPTRSETKLVGGNFLPNIPRLENTAARNRVINLKEYLGMHNLNTNLSAYLAGKSPEEISRILTRRKVPAVHHASLARLAAPTINERYYRFVRGRTNFTPRNIINSLVPVRNVESSRAVSNRARVRQLISRDIEQAAWKKARDALKGVVNIIPPAGVREPKERVVAVPRARVQVTPVVPKPPPENIGHGVWLGKTVQKGARGGLYIVTNRGSKQYLPKK
jgi:hypothetical protein